MTKINDSIFINCIMFDL